MQVRFLHLEKTDCSLCIFRLHKQLAKNVPKDEYLVLTLLQAVLLLEVVIYILKINKLTKRSRKIV